MGICIVCQTNESEIKCDIRDNNENYEIHICSDCLELAEDYFIFVCMECGATFLRAKEDFIKTLEKRKNDPKYEGMQEAYELTKGERIIQGLSECLECNPFKFYRKTGNA